MEIKTLRIAKRNKSCTLIGLNWNANDGEIKWTAAEWVDLTLTNFCEIMASIACQLLIDSFDGDFNAPLASKILIYFIERSLISWLLKLQNLSTTVKENDKTSEGN